MNKQFLSVFLVAIVSLLFGFQTTAQAQNNQFLGVWHYEIPDAGPGYDKGSLVFTEKDGETICVVKLEAGDVTANDLKIKGDSVTFSTSVQGSTYKVGLKLENKKLLGTVESVQGSVQMTAVKSNPLMGEWLYEVSEAPYGYEKGSLIFSEKDGQMNCVIKLEAGELTVSELKIENEKITFTTSVDGNAINCFLTFENDKLVGKVDSPEGPKTITATKKM